MGAACCYALSVVFAKGAYANDVAVATLTLWRFAIGAAVFWMLVAIRRPGRLDRRTILTCIGLGGVGYAVQALSYFGAVAVMDAGLAALLVYTYPAIIVVIGFLTRRESPTRKRLVALGCSAAGMLLLLGLGGFAAVSPVGIGLGLTAGVTYAIYTIVASSLPPEADATLLMAIVASSALVSVAAFATVTGQPLGLSPEPVVLGWVLTYVLVGTILAMLLHQSGITRVGASTGGILSSIEPLVAAGAVAVVYGETMTPVQVIGGLAILAGVVVVQLPARATQSAGSSSSIGSRARGTGRPDDGRPDDGGPDDGRQLACVGAAPGPSSAAASSARLATPARDASAMTSSGRGGTVWSTSRTSSS